MALGGARGIEVYIPFEVMKVLKLFTKYAHGVWVQK